MTAQWPGKSKQVQISAPQPLRYEISAFSDDLCGSLQVDEGERESFAVSEGDSLTSIMGIGVINANKHTQCVYYEFIDNNIALPGFKNRKQRTAFDDESGISRGNLSESRSVLLCTYLVN